MGRSITIPDNSLRLVYFALYAILLLAFLLLALSALDNDVWGAGAMVFLAALSAFGIYASSRVQDRTGSGGTPVDEQSGSNMDGQPASNQSGYEMALDDSQNATDGIDSDIEIEFGE